MSLEQISETVKRLEQNSTISDTHIKSLTDLIKQVSDKSDNKLSQMMLLLEKSKDETSSIIKQVSTKAISNEAAIKELCDNMNRVKSGYISTNNRLDDLDSQQKQTSHLHGLDARINSSMAAVKEEDLLLTMRSVAIFNLAGQSRGDADNSFRDIFGDHLDPEVSPSEIIFKELGRGANVYILVYTNKDVAIKAITALRGKLDIHMKSSQASASTSTIGIGDFFDRSMSAVRRAMMAKASFIRENFLWARVVRLRLSRSTGQIHLAAYAVPDFSQALKERGQENHAVINIGTTIGQLSDPDLLNFRQIKRSRSQKPCQPGSIPASQSSSAAPSRTVSPAPGGFLPPAPPLAMDPSTTSTTGSSGKASRGRSASRTGQSPDNKRLAPTRGGRGGGAGKKPASVQGKS